MKKKKGKSRSARQSKLGEFGFDFSPSNSEVLPASLDDPCFSWSLDLRSEFFLETILSLIETPLPNSHSNAHRQCQGCMAAYEIQPK